MLGRLAVNQSDYYLGPVAVQAEVRGYMLASAALVPCLLPLSRTVICYCTRAYGLERFSVRSASGFCHIITCTLPIDGMTTTGWWRTENQQCRGGGSRS
jgi:hypothetical protein